MQVSGGAQLHSRVKVTPKSGRSRPAHLMRTGLLTKDNYESNPARRRRRQLHGAADKRKEMQIRRRPPPPASTSFHHDECQTTGSSPPLAAPAGPRRRNRHRIASPARNFRVLAGPLRAIFIPPRRRRHLVLKGAKLSRVEEVRAMSNPGPARHHAVHPPPPTRPLGTRSLLRWVVQPSPSQTEKKHKETEKCLSAKMFSASIPAKEKTPPMSNACAPSITAQSLPCTSSRHCHCKNCVAGVPPRCTY